MNLEISEENIVSKVAKKTNSPSKRKKMSLDSHGLIKHRCYLSGFNRKYFGDFSFQVKDKILSLSVRDVGYILRLPANGRFIDIQEKGEAAVGSSTKTSLQ